MFCTHASSLRLYSTSSTVACSTLTPQEMKSLRGAICHYRTAKNQPASRHIALSEGVVKIWAAQYNFLCFLWEKETKQTNFMQKLIIDVCPKSGNIRRAQINQTKLMTIPEQQSMWLKHIYTILCPDDQKSVSATIFALLPTCEQPKPPHHVSFQGDPPSSSDTSSTSSHHPAVKNTRYSSSPYHTSSRGWWRRCIACTEDTHLLEQRTSTQ